MGSRSLAPIRSTRKCPHPFRFGLTSSTAACMPLHVFRERSVLGPRRSGRKCRRVMYPHNIQMITRPPPGLLAVMLVVLAASGVQVAEGAYTLRRVGNCGPHTFISSITDCEAAAVALRLNDIEASAASQPATNIPHGCYFKRLNTIGFGLWWNPGGTRSSRDSYRVSVCIEGKHPLLGLSRWKGLQAMTLHPTSHCMLGSHQGLPRAGSPAPSPPPPPPPPPCSGCQCADQRVTDQSS